MCAALAPSACARASVLRRSRPTSSRRSAAHGTRRAATRGSSASWCAAVGLTNRTRLCRAGYAVGSIPCGRLMPRATRRWAPRPPCSAGCACTHDAPCDTLGFKSFIQCAKSAGTQAAELAGGRRGLAGRRVPRPYYTIDPKAARCICAPSAGRCLPCAHAMLWLVAAAESCAHLRRPTAVCVALPAQARL